MYVLAETVRVGYRGEGQGPSRRVTVGTLNPTLSMSDALPLAGVTVIEVRSQDVIRPLTHRVLTTAYRAGQFAGLAPGPYAGQVLQDWGARVIRVDRVERMGAFPDFLDLLTRGKRSITVNPKVPSGLNLLKKMIQQSDVLIDPFRPGVMERLGLGPEVFLGKDGLNDSLVYARLSGCVYHLCGVPETFRLTYAMLRFPREGT